MNIIGGRGNALIGKYFHDTNFALTATDALWNLQYLALSFGTQVVESNVETLTTESDVAITVANTITVSGTPTDWGRVGTIGWYRLPSETEWHMITFSGKSATVSGLAVGDTVCVMYNSIDNTAREIIIPEMMIPSEIHATLTQNLMLGDQGDVATYANAGYIEIDIPRFQMNVDQTLTMSSSGASTTSLSGNALVTYEGGGCDEAGYYARIKEVVFGRKFYEGITDLAIVGGTLGTGDVVVVKGIKANGVVTINPANLTYTGATVDEDGEITAITGTVLTAALYDGGATIPEPYASMRGVAQLED